MAEQWRDVVGFEGLYEVSDQGRVRSLRRVDRFGRTQGGSMLTPVGLRHLHVTLSLQGIKTKPTVHRLMLEAFVGPCPPGMKGLHADDDPSNNTLSNLRWGTTRENSADSARNGRQPRGSRMGNARLTESDIPVIRRLLSEGSSHRSIADLYGVNISTIGGIARGRNWRHV